MNDKNMEILIKYKPKKDNEEKVRIFGKNFVNNNIHKCKIIYKEEEYELKEYLKDIDIFYDNKEEFEIKLKGINNITNMSFMFYECNSLSSLPDISKWNTSNVNNMSYMFSECKSLSSLPDISKWNTSNVNDMSFMFSECNSLSSLPDISKWDTSNVNSMWFMFSECKSLSSLPDISKWNTSNVKSMYNMFDGCINSLEIPSKFI